MTETNALLIDLDGVLYEGDRVIDGAPQTVAWLESQQIPHRFLTNTTSRPRSALAAKLDHLGFGVEPARILTPPVAAAAWLRARGVRRVAAYVPAATRYELRDFELVDPDAADAHAEAVLIGDLGRGWSFDVLNQAFRLLMTPPPPRLVALGMTRYWKAPDGLRLDTAPFVMALSHASGIEPVVVGKPAKPFFDAALDQLGSSPGETVMIGDDLTVDVGGAQAAGLRGVLVRTGKYRGEERAAGACPDAVLDSIAELPEWWRRQQQRD